MTPRQHGDAKRPTPRQLSYLKGLAERTGQTFTYPRTFVQARSEIDRLKAVRPESGSDRRRERKEIADAIAYGPDDASRVRDSETTGYGSGRSCR